VLVKKTSNQFKVYVSRAVEFLVIVVAAIVIVSVAFLCLLPEIPDELAVYDWL
jgi:hypothetical protein